MPVYPDYDERPKPTRSKCVVCGGKVVEKIERRYDPSTGPIRIGIFGRRNTQFREFHEGFHCSSCGLKYEFPPKVKRSKSK